MAIFVLCDVLTKRQQCPSQSLTKNALPNNATSCRLEPQRPLYIKTPNPSQLFSAPSSTHQQIPTSTTQRPRSQPNYSQAHKAPKGKYNSKKRHKQQWLLPAHTLPLLLLPLGLLLLILFPTHMVLLLLLLLPLLPLDGKDLFGF